MSTRNFKSDNIEDTAKLATEIGNKILEEGPKKIATVVALFGDLGAGKTEFVKSFAKSLGIKERILSPTFVLMKRFSINKKGFSNLYHFDCYRISSSEEIINLGFNRIIKNPENIIIIEWAEKIKDIIPENKIELKINIKDKNKREIKIKGHI